MGSPEISLPFLDFLYKKESICAVFTQPDKIRARGKKPLPTPVSIRADELGIPVYKCSVKSPEAFEIMNTIKPDILFVVAYGQIVPRPVLNIPELYPLNVHFSLLPQYRGATPVNTSLLEGKEKTGTTIMIMDEGLDTGKILLKAECPVSRDDNATSLFEKLIGISLDLLEENWGKICSGELKATPQNNEEATYTKLIKKEDLILDFKDNSNNLNNRIRAFNFEPGTKTFFRGKTLFIEKAESLSEINGNPGEIIAVEKKSFTVGCIEGAIKILAVKPEGKRSMHSEAFINGYKPIPGERLG